MAEEGLRSMKMAELSPCICAICFQGVRDARLLTCFHSFCKTCLDDLEMTTGHAHKIRCPVCRSTSRLPKNGASGLARDITLAAKTTFECDTCRTEGGEGKAGVSCTTCDLSFCNQHGMLHELTQSASNHHLVGLPKDAAPSSERQTTSSARLCDEHGLPTKLFCQQCKIPICGDCTALGGHQGHEPIVAIKDIAVDLKHRVRRNITALQNTRLPDAQQSLLAVEDVSSQLSSRADKVRTEICSAAKRINHMVEVVMEQKLAEVDDLEELRLKHLNCQHDELKEHVDSLKSVIGFSEKVLEADTETQEVCDVLFSVEKRAEELDKSRVAQKLAGHAHVNFKSVSEETLLTKVKELVGVVIRCDASATHSFVDGQTDKACLQDSSVSFVVIAKDTNDQRLATGGDHIRVELERALASDHYGPSCDVCDVVDHNNGTYTISATPHRHGDYSLDIFINSEILQQRLTISCVPVAFDPVECQAGNVVSEDKLTVTHTGGDRWSSVLSSGGMSTGQHVWKVKVTESQSMNIFLGVAEKPGLTAKSYNYDTTYIWSGWDGTKWSKGKQRNSVCPWQENDVIQLDLNCTNHTLSMTNFRSGETDAINNLPPTEVFAYFCSFNDGDSLTLID